MSAELLTETPTRGIITDIYDVDRCDNSTGWFYLNGDIVMRREFREDSVDISCTYCHVSDVISFIPDKENNNE